MVIEIIEFIVILFEQVRFWGHNLAKKNDLGLGQKDLSPQKNISQHLLHVLYVFLQTFMRMDIRYLMMPWVFLLVLP